MLLGCEPPAAPAPSPPSPPVVAPVPEPPAPPHGPLDGLVVYLSAGHGYATDRWGAGYQREPGHGGLVEDLWTAELASERLIPRLEAAGAVVLTARERDPSSTAVDVVPDSVSDVLWREWPAPDGSWQRAVPVPRLGTDGQAVFTVDRPRDGQWIYLRWLAHPSADADARVSLTQGERKWAVRVDQRHHDRQWWPVGRSEGEAPITLTLSGSGTGTLSADQVRVGGGSVDLDLVRSEQIAHLRRWELAAVHHLAAEDAPSWVWATRGVGSAGDATSRARWAGWAHHPEEQAVFLSLHTNAGGGRGTVFFVREACPEGEVCPPRSDASTALAHSMRPGIVAAFREGYPTWKDRGVRTNDLAETSAVFNPDMPAVLVELGFHDRARDVEQLLDPGVMERVSEAMVDGLVDWYAAQPQAMAPSGSQ